MIQHEQYRSQTVNTIYYYLDMQYEVHLTDQTQEIDPKLNGSFKNFSHLIQNSIKNQPEFSRTCDFRGDFRESLNFYLKPSKEIINDLDFPQNPLKVEKVSKKAPFCNYGMIQNFPGKNGRVALHR